MQFSALLQNKKFLIIGGTVIILLIGSLGAGIIASSLPSASTAKDNANNATTPGVSGQPATGKLATTRNSVQTAEPTLGNPDQFVYIPTVTPTPTRAPGDYLLPTEVPTTTPFPGVFYIANGKQNDLQIMYVHQQTGDSFDEIHLRNNKTTEERLLGYIYHYTPGDPAFFSKDFSQVYFLGSDNKENYNQVSVYSIAQKRIIKAIPLVNMKKVLPQLQTDQLAALSMLLPSPDKSKMAMSYGITYSTNRIDPNTSIIVINIATGQMQLLPVKGLVHAWKDNTTLQYDNNTADPNVNTTQEIQISGI
jgi:hypothetical protein